MQFKFSSVKGASGNAELIGNVALLVGPNGSGKSAFAEAFRLAFTGTTSIGSSPQKLKVFASGSKCEAKSNNILAKCEIGNSRKHSLHYSGLEVNPKSFFSVPIDLSGFSGLTGEERWQLVESAVGAFTKPAPEGVGELRNELERLQSAKEPEMYEGPGRPELVRQLADVESQIEEARQSSTIKRNGEAASSRLPELREKEAMLEDKIQMATKLLEDISRNEDRVKSLVSQYAGSPEQVFCECDTVQAACNKVQQIVDKLAELGCEVNFWFAVPESSRDLPTPIADEIREVFRQCDLASPASFLSAADELAQEIRIIEVGMRSSQVALDACRNEIEVCKDKITAANELPQEDEVRSLIEQQAEIKLRIAACDRWNAWVENRVEVMEQQDQLKRKIEEAEQEIAEYQSERAAYLEDSIGKLHDWCEKITEPLGLPSISLELERKGKRNSLKVMCGEYQIESLSGGENVLYGNILLSAFQEMSTCPHPIQIVEASELDASSLGTFLNAMSNCRTKGNVLVCHHAMPAIAFEAQTLTFG